MSPSGFIRLCRISSQLFLCRCSHQRAICKCTAASCGQLLPHIIVWHLVHWSFLFVTTVACHFAAVVFSTHAGWEVRINSTSGQRLSMCFLFLTHLEPLWWAAVTNSFSWRGWLMMFSERVGPPTAESCTCNQGGLIDRLRSWKLQTKGLLWKCMQN